MGTDAGRRRRTSRMVTLACAGTLLLSVTGCAAEPPPSPTSATPTAEPVFATDAEALAAAEEAYENYLAAHDSFWSSGATSEEAFLALTTGSAHDADAQTLAKFRSQGWKVTGASAFDTLTIQSVAQGDDGKWKIRTYLCLDASSGDVVDSAGVSVAKPDRPRRLPLEVEFVSSSDSLADLKISESEAWSGSDFC